MADRDEKGKFAEGHKGIGGRPNKAREAALLAIGQEIISQKGIWGAVVRKAVADALGQIVVKRDGQDVAIPDPDSTAAGRNTARTFLRDSFIGRPTEYIATDLADSPFEQLAAYSADDIAAAIAAIEQRRSGRDDSSDSADGTGAAGEAELGGS